MDRYGIGNTVVECDAANICGRRDSEAKGPICGGGGRRRVVGEEEEEEDDAGVLEDAVVRSVPHGVIEFPPGEGGGGGKLGFWHLGSRFLLRLFGRKP